MSNVYPIFRDLRQFLLIVTLTLEVLPSNLQLYTSSFVLTCRFYKVFGLLCPDCTGLDSYSGSSAGLDWIRISGSWIWTGLDRLNSIHSILCRQRLSYFRTDDVQCWEGSVPAISRTDGLGKTGEAVSEISQLDNSETNNFLFFNHVSGQCHAKY